MLDDPQSAGWVLLDAILAAASEGHKELAHNLLPGIEDIASLKLVAICIALGDLDNARRVLPRLSEDCDLQAKAVVEIARSQARSRRFKAASKMVETIGTYSEPSLVAIKSNAFASIVAERARAGEISAARGDIDHITLAHTDSRSSLHARFTEAW